MFFESVPLDTVVRAALLSTLALIWVVFVVRVIGLRAFSKMTSFDFVVTVATGSLLAGASQATTWPDFVQSCLAITTLLSVQFVVARWRRASDKFQQLSQNTPILLMQDGAFLPEALRETRVARNDIHAKLREANVLSLSDVRAVVLETTGDISVLHGPQLETELLVGVRTRV
ncbi:YetF domain-containing protein [Labrenzia sp. 011]|uniref:DUF421 domain-containing protein n=1 Tax=Labrenzia sp. 011 TaxID=2171494 RepID=UPI000D51044A|nr:YetF domain-containing protein [Labrenzia sp. 011]PVB62648.1 DUF421 domain-containing protein [Labrenzia sp. 011]